MAVIPRRVIIMAAYISAVDVFFPTESLTNEDLEKSFPEWSVGKIESKTGIRNRYIAGESQSVSDLAVGAALNLFRNSNIDKSKIDFILLCTQSPDYVLPTTACIVHERLSLEKACGAMDFNLGCSGFVYGLGLAKGLIESGQCKNVLLITSEVYSKHIHPLDKSVRTIFGDGAAATLISDDGEQRENIGCFVYGTDGSGAKNLIIPDGGIRSPLSPSSFVEATDSSGNVRTPSNLYMHGSEIFTFTLKSVPLAIDQLCEKSSLSLDDFDYFIFHQANKFMLEQLRVNLKIPKDKFLTSYENYGNTVSSTIPIGLFEAANKNQFKPGDRILLIGFGVGYSWAATYIIWTQEC